LSYALALRIDLRKGRRSLHLASLWSPTPALQGFKCPAAVHDDGSGVSFFHDPGQGKRRVVNSCPGRSRRSRLRPPFDFHHFLSALFSRGRGILWLAPGILSLISFQAYEIRKGILYRFYLYFCGLASVTVAAVLFLLPVTSSYFHRVSLVSFLANMTALPHYGNLHPAVGLLAVACLPLSQDLANSVLAVAAWGLDRMMDYVNYWSGFPWTEIQVFRPNFAEILLCYGFFILSYLSETPEMG